MRRAARLSCILLANKIECCLVSYREIEFQVHGDQQGSLVALEGCKDIPFQIKRVYYIYGTQREIVRGKHAHKDLEQVIICVSGSCDFIVDDGAGKKTFKLDRPNKGLYVGDNVWREFTNFSGDCVVVVLANQAYTPDDYIKDYELFKKEIGKAAK